MKLEEIYDNLRAILVDQLQVKAEDIKPESELIADLGINSLELADLVLACEEKFNVEIKDDEIRKFMTLKDIATYLDVRINHLH